MTLKGFCSHKMGWDDASMFHVRRLFSFDSLQVQHITDQTKMTLKQEIVISSTGHIHATDNIKSSAKILLCAV